MQNTGSFDRFTERARKVLTLAQEEAQRFNHNYIGTEHLLLGLVREGDGVAAKVLSNLGIELTNVRGAVESIIGRGERQVMGDLGLAPAGKKVIELAVDEARRLGHHYVGTEHLLLGLIREGDGIAADVLKNLGVTLEKVRGEVIKVLTQTGPGAPADDSELRSRLRVRVSRAFRNRESSGNQDPGPVDYSRFTERALRVMKLSQEEALRFNHNYIGTEHILLGLAREGEGVAAKALSNLGIELTRVRSAVEFIIGRGERQITGDIGLTPRAKKVVALAIDESHRMGHHYIGTEHLLLGLIREGEGIAAGVLESLGVSLERVRPEVIRVLTETGYVPPEEPQEKPIMPPDSSGWSYLVFETVRREGAVHVLRINGKPVPAGQDTSIDRMLQQFGDAGWELVGIDPAAEEGGSLYLLKRRRS